jgi:hypothetical protein
MHLSPRKHGGKENTDMSYAAEQIVKQEQEDAEREMALWMAVSAIREGLKRGDPDALELVKELNKEQA